MSRCAAASDGLQANPVGREWREVTRRVGDASLPKVPTRRVHNKMNVLVIGGTGFVGYHAVQEFLRRGHCVTVLALPPMPTDDLLPPDVIIRLADLNELPDEDVRALLQGQDALVYGQGGLDEAFRDTVRACSPAHR